MKCWQELTSNWNASIHGANGDVGDFLDRLVDVALADIAGILEYVGNSFDKRDILAFGTILYRVAPHIHDECDIAAFITALYQAGKHDFRLNMSAVWRSIAITYGSKQLSQALSTIEIPSKQSSQTQEPDLELAPPPAEPHNVPTTVTEYAWVRRDMLMNFRVQCCYQPKILSLMARNYLSLWIGNREQLERHVNFYRQDEISIRQTQAEQNGTLSVTPRSLKRAQENSSSLHNQCHKSP